MLFFVVVFSVSSVSASSSYSSPFVVSVVELTRELPPEENSTLLFPFHVMNESDVPLLMGPQPGQSLSNEDEDTDTASAALSTGRWRFGDIRG